MNKKLASAALLAAVITSGCGASPMATPSNPAAADGPALASPADQAQAESRMRLLTLLPECPDETTTSSSGGTQSGTLTASSSTTGSGETTTRAVFG